MQWDKVLNLLGEALEQNSVNYRILKTGNKYKKILNDFKVSKLSNHDSYNQIKYFIYVCRQMIK